MLPMLFGDFEWSYSNPKAEKRTQCTFSVRYMNLMMQWKERSKADVSMVEVNVDFDVPNPVEHSPNATNTIIFD
jgi:hypothetical protein